MANDPSSLMIPHWRLDSARPIPAERVHLEARCKGTRPQIASKDDPAPIMLSGAD